MSRFAKIALAASFACNALAAPSPFYGDELSSKFGKDFEQKFNEFFGIAQDDASSKGSSSSSDDASTNGVDGADGAQAVYFISNDAENSVVALPIGDDGTLSFGSVTATGGAGSNAVDPETGDDIVPDALVSQSTLTITGNNLFAVNAGSNTLTMMAINPDDVTELSMVGEPVDLPGDFPNTVSASADNGLVCVGMSGEVNGVSCARFSDDGLEEMDDLRSFDIDQVTPPTGPTNTVSQVFFSDDQSMLFATVKGDPEADITGFFSAFPVETDDEGNASVAAEDIRSSPDGTAVLFGSLPIPGTSSVFVTDASFGGAIMSVNEDGEAELVAEQAIDNQVATCWVTISSATDSAFVTDVGVNQIVEMSLEDASILSQTDLSENGNPGLIDLRAAGDFIYVLSPGDGTIPAAVTVLDVSAGQGAGPEMIQNFELDESVAGGNSMGMAIF